MTTDLTPGQPTGGPATPTKQAQDLLPLPAPPAAVASDDLSQLSPEELQARIDARERDMKFRLRAIRHEVRELGSDVMLGDRPALDWIRDHKERALAYGAGAGLVLGLLVGLIARARRRPDPDDTEDFIRLRMSSLLDEAATRVARGESVESAADRVARSAPVVYADRSTTVAARSSLLNAVDLGLKTLVGVVAKSVGDELSRSISGTPHPPA